MSFWCHLPFQWFFLCLSMMGFPHMAQSSHQLPVPLSSSLKMETCLAVHQLFDQKWKELLMSGGSWHFGIWSCGWGWTLSSRIPSQGGAWDLRKECHIYDCLLWCLTPSFFILSYIFHVHSMKPSVSIMWKCRMVNPFGLEPRFLMQPL